MIPTRLALATLSVSWWWWLLLYVFVPTAVLAGSLRISSQFANGIVGLCGFLLLALWATGQYNYDRPRTRIDPAARTLTVSQKNTDRGERSVDLDRVESVSVQVFGTMALVRIDAHSFSRLERFLLPEPVLVPADRLPTALTAIHTAGVTVPEVRPENDGRSIETVVKLAVTPLVLVGVPSVALLVFGRSILGTNGAVVVFLLGLMAVVQELRASDNG